MQNHFVWPGEPIFVKKKVQCRLLSRRLRDETRVTYNPLQLRTGVTPHRSERKPVQFFDLPHHRQHGFHRQRVGLNKIRLHQRQIFAMNLPSRCPIVVQRSPCHLGHLSWNLIRRHRDNSNPSKSDDRQSQSVVARQNRKALGHEIAHLRNLPHVAAGFLDTHNVRDFPQPRQRARFDVGPRPPGNVIENHRLLHSLGDCTKMLVLPFLCRLVVVRRSRENGVHSRSRGRFSCFLHRIMRGI